jgi:tetratricopeptide (TPR) repeat protein
MYSRAEPALKRCADRLSDDGEVASPEFGDAANSLAIVYQFTGKYALADRYFNYAETIRENTLGILSPELADTLETHAILLHQLGRDKEAKDKERLAAEIRAHAKRR